MDVALLLLLPAVGGYIFSTNFVHSRYQTFREDGRRVYFRAIFYAVVFLVAAFLIRLFLIATFEEHYLNFELFFTLEDSNFLLKSGGEEKQVRFILICMYSLVIGSVIWYPINIAASFVEKTIRIVVNKLKSDSEFKYVIPYFLWNSIKDDDFERIIAIAATRPMPIMVTMSNGKVYAGYVTNTVDPCVERKGITILPLLSGYRNQENGEVTFTTYYTVLYDAIDEQEKEIKHLTRDDFEVVLPLDKAQSISMFDFDAYERFNVDNFELYKL